MISFNRPHFYVQTIGLFLISFGALAQQIRMGPPIIEIMSTPGSEKIFYFTLLNQSESDVQCAISVKSMALTDQGMPYPVESAERSAANWIQVKEDTVLVLRGQENKRIMCGFKPPLNTEPGGYYGMILCRTMSPQRITSGATAMQPQVNLRFQFTSVVMGMVKGSRVEARVNPGAPIIYGGNRGSSSEGKNWYVEVPVTNDGNIHVVLKGLVRILSEFGDKIAEAPMGSGRGYVLPGQKRMFRAEGNGPLTDGVFVADVRIGQSEIDKWAMERIPFYILNGQVYPGYPDKPDAATLSETSQGFVLDKWNLDIVGVPGGKKYQAIQIINISNRPIKVETRFLPWSQNAQGDIVYSDTDNTGRQLSQNMMITPDHLELESKERAIVKVTVNIPRNGEGEYFDALIFNREGVPLPKSSDLLLTQSVLFATKVNRTEKTDAELQRFDVDQNGDKGFIFNIDLINKGNARIYPDGRISIFDDQNMRVDDPISFGGNFFVLPQNRRTIAVLFERLLPGGSYRAELTIDYYQGQPSLTKMIDFSVK